MEFDALRTAIKFWVEPTFNFPPLCSSQITELFLNFALLKKSQLFFFSTCSIGLFRKTERTEWIAHANLLTYCVVCENRIFLFFLSLRVWSLFLEYRQTGWLETLFNFGLQFWEDGLAHKAEICTDHLMVHHGPDIRMHKRIDFGLLLEIFSKKMKILHFLIYGVIRDSGAD
jgi:hypothetical protein